MPPPEIDQRMNIPVDEILSEINLFAVDDYLRLIQSPEERRDLILTIGYSPRKRAAFERKHQLPRGAIELAMLLHDRQFKELNSMLLRELNEMNQVEDPKEISPARYEAFYQRVYAMASGLTRRYPEAMDFLLQYSILNERNRRHFAGDYKFSPEYQLQMVNFCPPPGAPGGLNCNTAINLSVNLNLGVNVNIGANVNAVANIKVAINIAAWIFIGVSVCFFAAGWPALYGPNIMELARKG
jgi:hypothetical protein